MFKLLFLAALVLHLSSGIDLKPCLASKECEGLECGGQERCLWNRCLCINLEESQIDKRARLEGSCETKDECVMRCKIHGFFSGVCFQGGCTCIQAAP